MYSEVSNCHAYILKAHEYPPNNHKAVQSTVTTHSKLQDYETFERRKSIKVGNIVKIS